MLNLSLLTTLTIMDFVQNELLRYFFNFSFLIISLSHFLCIISQNLWCYLVHTTVKILSPTLDMKMKPLQTISAKNGKEIGINALQSYLRHVHRFYLDT